MRVLEAELESEAHVSILWKELLGDTNEDFLDLLARTSELLS